MGSDQVSHPLFARVYARLSAKGEEKGQAEHRRELLAGMSGRVIEVGAGHGLNFPHYPETVTEVVAVEPEAHLRRLATEAAGNGQVPITVIDGVAGAIPAEDEEFDGAVACLMLCTVPDQASALAELYRVVRPGGELRFYEHVLAESSSLARAQRVADKSGIWPLFAGGCHASRDTTAAIEAAGFEIEHCRRFPFRAEVVEFLATPKILGSARRPSSPTPQRPAFRKYGYHGATIERIAAEAGLSRVTLHRRKVTKALLLTALAEQATAAQREALWPALTGDGSGAQRLRQALEALCQSAEEQLELLVALRAQSDAVFHAQDDQGLTRSVFTEPLERLLRDGASDGSLRSDLDPVEMATVLFNLVGWTYVHLRTGHGWTARRAAASTIGVALHGVAR